MTVTFGSLVSKAADALSATGFEEPRRQARRLVASALAISPTELFGHPDRVPDTKQFDRFNEMLDRALQHEPLSRILGWREFWCHEFFLSAETLDPRPETETLVEAVLKRKSCRRAPLRFLDLGTGTGCLLLSLLGEFPMANGVGIDISETAVRTASGNAATLGIADRALFLVGDWGAAASGRFDAIVANPPYIATGDLALLPREVACHDPMRALDGGADGLRAYRAIVADLPRLLASNGIFVGEVGVDQADRVGAMLNRSGLHLDGVDKDLAGISRCVVGRLARP